MDEASTSNQVIEQFIASHEYTIPVLRSSFNYMIAAGLEDATPTTLFVDPKGDIVFKKLGGSAHLVQEFDWRLVAMGMSPAAASGPAAEAGAGGGQKTQ